MPRLHTFFTLFMGTALALASFTTIISCNGNGGSSYSEGEIYTPGGVGGGALLMARRAAPALAPQAAPVPAVT